MAASLPLFLSFSVNFSNCCIYLSACQSLPLAPCIVTFICDGIVFCVQTRFTLRDYNVTGDTIGTLDEVMHLSVLLIPCFKSRFPLGLHLPIQGQECVDVVSDKHSNSSHVLSPTLRMSLEVTKVVNPPSWRSLHACVPAGLS